MNTTEKVKCKIHNTQLKPDIFRNSMKRHITLGYEYNLSSLIIIQLSHLRLNDLVRNINTITVILDYWWDGPFFLLWESYGRTPKTEEDFGCKNISKKQKKKSSCPLFKHLGLSGPRWLTIYTSLKTMLQNTKKRKRCPRNASLLWHLESWNRKSSVWFNFTE